MTDNEDLTSPRTNPLTATPQTGAYLDDLQVGQKITGTKTIAVTAENVVAFASRFDPQPFHMDPDAGKASVFKGHAASGWHTASMTMRLILEEGPLFPGGQIGLEIKSLKWPQPTLVGDVLRIRNTVESVRPSAKNPTHGIAIVRTETLNQRDEVVQDQTAVLFLPCRPKT